jgi:hypothetical protein
MEILFICNDCSKNWREKDKSAPWYRELFRNFTDAFNHQMEYREHTIDLFIEDNRD